MGWPGHLVGDVSKVEPESCVDLGACPRVHHPQQGQVKPTLAAPLASAAQLPAATTTTPAADTAASASASIPAASNPASADPVGVLGGCSARVGRCSPRSVGHTRRAAASGGAGVAGPALRPAAATRADVRGEDGGEWRVPVRLRVNGDV